MEKSLIHSKFNNIHRVSGAMALKLKRTAICSAQNVPIFLEECIDVTHVDCYFMHRVGVKLKI